MNCTQTDKATIQLAANAADPAIRSLIIDLLNELQPEVDECYKSEAGQKLLKMVEEQQQLQDAVVETREGEMLAQKSMEQETAESTKELLQLAPNNPEVMPEREKRSHRPVERFSLLDFKDNGEYIASKEERQARKDKDKEIEPCEICCGRITEKKPAGTCSLCFVRAHYKCHGVAPGDEEEFRCATCAKSKAKKSKSTSRKGKQTASVEDDDSDAASEAGDSSYAGSVEEVDEDTGSEYAE
jgi:hypothetical protein